MSERDTTRLVLHVSNSVQLPLSEIEFDAIRAQGAGGQHVNKVSSAVHLRLDIRASSLPEHYKERLLAFRDNRISKEGVIVIKAQSYRSRAKNRDDALSRLKELITAAMVVQKTRRKTKPTRGSQRKRMDSKSKRGKVKSLRKRVDY